jgi:hypothetical protein
MNTLKLVFFVFLARSVQLEPKLAEIKPHKPSDLVAAVAEAITKVLSKSISAQNFILPESSHQVDIHKEELLRILLQLDEVSVRQEEFTKVRSLSGRRRRCMTILIEKVTDFVKVSSFLRPEHVRFNGLYVIAIVTRGNHNLVDIFNTFWRLKIFNVNVISQNESGMILVQTFMPFKRLNCNDTSSVVINEFRGGKFLNGTDQFYPKKMNNFHNCSLKVGVTIDSEPYFIARQEVDGNFQFSGEDVELVQELSRKFNFYTNITYIQQTGVFFENGTATGSFQLLREGQVDMIISGWLLKHFRLNFFDASVPYNFDHIIFVIPPGRTFTSMENLIYPFTSAVWLFIGLCFFFGLCVIVIVKQLSKQVQSFVFGSNVNHPILNLITTFLGGSQTLLPRRNFARFLLITFIFYSLVIRTVYQGLFYELLRTNKKFNDMQSINEIIEKDFKFYAASGIADFLKGTESINRR